MPNRAAHHRDAAATLEPPELRRARNASFAIVRSEDENIDRVEAAWGQNKQS